MSNNFWIQADTAGEMALERHHRLSQFLKDRNVAWLGDEMLLTLEDGENADELIEKLTSLLESPPSGNNWDKGK